MPAPFFATQFYFPPAHHNLVFQPRQPERLHKGLRCSFTLTRSSTWYGQAARISKSHIGPETLNTENSLQLVLNRRSTGAGSWTRIFAGNQDKCCSYPRDPRPSASYSVYRFRPSSALQL